MPHVVFVTPELSPLVKVGGIADVAGSLPRALKRLGIRTSVLLPHYGSIDRERHVWAAYERLVALGFTENLVKAW